MPMKKQMVSLTKEMLQAVEDERIKRKLSNIPETIRAILSDYFRQKNSEA